MINRMNKMNLGFKHFEIHGACLSPRTVVPAVPTIAPGIYEMLQDNDNNVYFSPTSTITDELVPMPDTVSEQIVREVEKFWRPETKAKFDKYGVIFKRGILLYGKQGTGKTCTITRVMENVVNAGGIVIFNPDARSLHKAVTRLREIQPEMNVLVVFEEFEGMCNNGDFKSLLDGELQLENVVYIATTNYIDQVPNTFKNRPSRFATVIEVGLPSAEARRIYLEAKLLGDDKQHIDEWVTTTEGMVIDQIKDLIVSVFCLDIPLQEAAAKIDRMELCEPNSEDAEDADDHFNHLKEAAVAMAMEKQSVKYPSFATQLAVTK